VVKNRLSSAITGLTVGLGGLLLLSEKALAAPAKSGGAPPVENFALVLGGIGIFLIGIHFAGEHLQKVTGQTFRDIIGRLSTNQLGVLSWGLVLGFLTQSGKATAFILSDFVHAGMVKARQSINIVFWGNAGSSLIVFASMLSVKVFALCLLGVTALGITFDIPKRLAQAYGAFFGLAMIMFGLYLVKSGATGFAAHPSVPYYMDIFGSFLIFSFVLGLVLTLIVQSNIAIMMIMIAMASSGLLSLPQAFVAILGAQLASGILTYIFSFHSHGIARQTVMSQIAFDVTATSVFLALFLVEYVIGIPLGLSFVRGLTNDVGTQTMFAALMLQFSGAIILVVIRKPVFDLIEKKYPPTAVEVLSHPEFLSEREIDSPETALLLVEKEQIQLLNRLPAYLEYVRNEEARPGLDTPTAHHQAFKEISALVSSTLSEISAYSLNQTSSDLLIKTTKIQEQLVRLEDSVFHIADGILGHSQESKALRLGLNIMESVDFMMLTAIEAIESGDDAEIETLALLTQDKAELMAKLRHDYFDSETDLSQEERSFILDVTILFENAVQTLARYGVLLKSS
jgi:phosphate:Na+ symporter